MSQRDMRRLERITQNALDHSLAGYERELIAVYNTVLDDVRSELAKTYEKYAVKGKLTNAQMTKYNRLTNLEHELNVIAGHGTQRARATIDRLTRDQYEESFFRHAWMIDQNIGVGLRWGTLRPETIKAAVANPLRLIAEDRLRGLGREKIRRVVAQGLTRGVSFDEMARGMRDAVVAKGRESLAYNALRVARTEGGRAQTLGTLEVYDKAEAQGVELQRQWVASLDDRTRDSHADMDGVIATDQGFPFPGLGFVDGPRLTGVAEEDINCRCTTIPVVKDLPPPILRRIRNEGVQPYQTYRQWRPKERG
jgi:SPP1 gp7 family putative phage head morphogenesis protein